MDFDPQEAFRQVAILAAKGWKICRLWGVRDDLTCTCGKPGCQNAGKHPHGGPGWQHRVTSDEGEIWSWLEDVKEHTRCNFGVRLGPTSGIIDVEFDSPEAAEVVRKYGLDLIDTPQYSSGRGVHRIFVHEDWMPDSAVVKVEGLEVRLGGGETAGQSVIPPSWHKTGKQYHWLPGKSPEDVNPARLPDSFREAVMASSRRQGSGLIAQSREALRGGNKIGEGGRHPFLVGRASLMASRIPEFTDSEREELVQYLLDVNSCRCTPPKSHDEVVKIAHDQFAYYRDRKIERLSKRPYERFGLVWNQEDHCWEPGQWRLTIVRSDPAEFKVRIPDPTDQTRALVVRVDSETITSARNFAVAVLEASKSIDLQDPNAQRWASLWNGENIRNADGGWTHIRGLRCKLFDDADYEVPPAESNVSSINAGILLEYLESFQKTENGDESDRVPNSSGLPKWIKDIRTGEWGLWLKWHETLAAAWRRKGMNPPGMTPSRDIKTRLDEEAGKKPQIGQKHGKKWQIFTDDHISALQRLRYGSEGEA